MEVKQEYDDSDYKDSVAIKQEPISESVEEPDKPEILEYSGLLYIKQEICDENKPLILANDEKYCIDKNSGDQLIIKQENSDLNLNIKSESTGDINVYCDDLQDLKSEDLDQNRCFNSTKFHKSLVKFKRRHSRKISKKNSYLCPICSRGCPSSKSRTKHVTSHFAKDFVTCRDCGQFFPDELLFVLHNFNHFVKRRKNSNAFRNSRVFRDKNTKPSPKIISKPFTCEICLKEFAQKYKLVAHSRIHTGEKPFLCSICFKRFADTSTLKRHYRIHTGEKPYQCEICLKAFSQSATLKTHLKKIHPQEIETINCNRKALTCEICSKLFYDSSALERHSRVHLDKCEICFKQFECRSNLLKHSRIHAGEKPFSCEICSKQFSCKSNLSKHLRIHTGEKPFICQICSKSFALKTNLISHSRIHTGEKPFKCEICSKGFSQKPNLLRHSKIHTREPPFNCEICSKSFSQSSGLKDHAKIHSEDKPFKCVICPRAFTRKAKLIEHSKKLHSLYDT